jgi:phosphate transport system ATP-binding protein
LSSAWLPASRHAPGSAAVATETERPRVPRPSSSAGPPSLVASERIHLAAHELSAYFGQTAAVRDVSIAFRDREVTAIIGPSGCGKSTLLRCLNRMHETIPAARVEGTVTLDSQDIYARGVNPIEVRRHIGMVFQRPTPFPTMSIRDNVAAGLRILGRKRPADAETDRIVEDALRRTALWDEVSTRLKESAVALSGHCLARPHQHAEGRGARL